MENRILGMDLSDMGTILSYYSEEESFSFPTAICKLKDSDGWCIGEEAYEQVLVANGIVTDKLLTLVQRNGRATLYGTKYTAENLLKGFLSEVIKRSSVGGVPSHIVVTLPQIDKNVVAVIRRALVSLGYNTENIYIISRAEAFIYYVMSQNQELRNNNVGLFSLDDNCLTYYELNVQRKAKSMQVVAEKEIMDESFSLDILKTDAGKKLADKILLSCAERVLKNKVFSAVILAGKGFERYDWADSFMRFICNRRKVFIDELVFSRGATYRGFDYVSDKQVFQFTPICDGRVECSIFVDITKNDRIVAYPVITAGECWYENDKIFRFIPYDTKEIELTIVPTDGRKRKTVHIPLNPFDKRKNKTYEIEMGLSFEDDSTLSISISDLGFGDFFKPQWETQYEEVGLWE